MAFWLQRLQCDTKVKYIADGTSPIYTRLAAEQSVVAYYPDEEQYRHYMKPEGHLPSPLWMPVWDEYEMEQLRTSRYQDIDHQTVRESLVALDLVFSGSILSKLSTFYV